MADNKVVGCSSVTGPGDPLGQMLVRAGVLSEEALEDVLVHQRSSLPFASLAYVLGHAGEGSLVRSLSQQVGVPGVVLEESVIDLSVFDAFDPGWLLANNVLPLESRERRLFVAVSSPRAAAGLIKQLSFEKDLNIEVRVGLHLCIARTIRHCQAARLRGLKEFRGVLAMPDARAPVYIVSDLVEPSPESEAGAAREAVVEAVTKEVQIEELLDISERTTSVGDDKDDNDTKEISTYTESEQVTDVGGGLAIDLDDSSTATMTKSEGPKCVLVVDDDFASRHLLAKEIEPLGFVVQTASSGSEAVRMLKHRPPDAVILDVMLPEIDGFQICRAIKKSKLYRHIPVVLMSAVIDSGKVSERVLRQYGADAYFEKPLNTERVRTRLHELLDGTQVEQATDGSDESFQKALALYREGDVDGAIEELRRGIDSDPLSTKHHFVLANLLQKKEMLYEAIDEYEVTVDLRPDYFPALTRLAYLYYKKGYSAKAIETWRRSLPYCEDQNLRNNIEVFMRKLIAEMQATELS